MIFFRQVWTLIVKNLLITFVRPSFTTTIRAFVLPVVFVAFMYGFPFPSLSMLGI